MIQTRSCHTLGGLDSAGKSIPQLDSATDRDRDRQSRLKAEADQGHTTNGLRVP